MSLTADGSRNYWVACKAFHWMCQSFWGKPQLGEGGTDDGRLRSRYVVGMKQAFHWMRDRFWVEYACFEENPSEDDQKYKSIGYRRAAITSQAISWGAVHEIQSLNQRLQMTLIRHFSHWWQVKMTDNNEEIEEFDSVQLTLDIKAMVKVCWDGIVPGG